MSTEQYKSLADAALVTGEMRYGTGKTEIWYFHLTSNPPFAFTGSFRLEKDQFPNPEKLEYTHVKIGVVNTESLEEAFMLMQGEVWSPDGQARKMIENSDTGHTSMSVGDVIRIPGRGTWMVDGVGFYRLD